MSTRVCFAFIQVKVLSLYFLDISIVFIDNLIIIIVFRLQLYSQRLVSIALTEWTNTEKGVKLQAF